MCPLPPQRLRIALESADQGAASSSLARSFTRPITHPYGGSMFRTTTLLAATSLTGFAMVGLAFRFLPC
ncbi:MAG: hypothetical protein ACK55R_06710 [Cyanobacteriota bacterium]|jgi:hypothetical protein